MQSLSVGGIGPADNEYPTVPGELVLDEGHISSELGFLHELGIGRLEVAMQAPGGPIGIGDSPLGEVSDCIASYDTDSAGVLHGIAIYS